MRDIVYERTLTMYCQDAFYAKERIRLGLAADWDQLKVRDQKLAGSLYANENSAVLLSRIVGKGLRLA